MASGRRMLEMVETDVIKRSVFDVLHYPLDDAYIFTYIMNGWLKIPLHVAYIIVAMLDKKENSKKKRRANDEKNLGRWKTWRLGLRTSQCPTQAVEPQFPGALWGFQSSASQNRIDQPPGLHLTVLSWSLCGERWVKLQSYGGSHFHPSPWNL